MFKWIQKALGWSKTERRQKRGALHRQLGIPEGEKIPLKVLFKHRHASGKLGRRVRLALTLRGLGRRKHRR